MSDITMGSLKIAEAEAKTENITRRLLFVMLTDLGIDPTSRIGLKVIDSFRPNCPDDGDVDREFTDAAILEFIKETLND